MTTLQFTHRLDTSNVEGSDERDDDLRLKWKIITRYFLDKSTKIKVTYWPNDFKYSGTDFDHSTYRVRDLSKYKLSKQSIDDEMEELVVPINNETIKILLHEKNEAIHDHISPIFHFDLLDDNDTPLYSSQDNGSTLLMKMSDCDDLRQLNERGINKGDIIDIKSEIEKNT